MLRQLGTRLQKFGETPLLLKMLCSVFIGTGKIPPNLGMVFREFTQFCENKRLEGVLVTDESRQWWRRLLQHLALKMTQASESTEFQVAIPKQEAQDILKEFLQQQGYHQPWKALEWLDDLLKYHLIQLGTENKIEFKHQLIQEYYTAESLLKQLPHFSDDKLKREYLNYLQWTEPLALMLGLLEEEKQALRVVKLALEVDLKLVARLAGAVKPEFQVQTVALVVGLEVSQELKFELLSTTRSEHAISPLLQALNQKDSYVHRSAANALGNIVDSTAVTGLIQALKDEDSHVRRSAANALGNIGDFRAVTPLIQALNDEYFHVLRSAANALGNIGNSTAVTGLIQALNDEHSSVRSSAADALGEIASPEKLPELTHLLSTTTKTYLLDTISKIQNRCKFYNYTLTQPPRPHPTPISISMTYILHLSDLHFGTLENADLWCSQLADDLKIGLDCSRLDVLILSGDIANKSTSEEYDAAKEFLDVRFVAS
ncbi:HEAT repeat domain-containing protein [Brasilonema octagenarum]|uniref:Uncharacterized protein n=1 Tax=Brasilonema octagenarum UFV-OR1 TaxID=417115 RepID=A0ABX1MAP2_9CYAN|nr:HEAT repeat domain-containing protein [Brasilonema octagenarum]NMF65628.1 hypothetical protein [Brasilonema octagenarum UFV-OR1]